ncbi:cysteine desulfurase family protein [Alteriqipengyuania sp.]|uniref:cysteine desulfurase family protein n=1 Tax=Alteriqipengyuania sp. TaxID=2800692 RepID=UPI003519916A
MSKPRIYLDHAATSPLRPEAKAAMEEGFAIWANPSSPHAEGRKAKQALEDARVRVKAALKWDGEVIFTSGASEALWIALNRAKVDRSIVSAVEHDAVFRAAPDAEVLPIDNHGLLQGGELDYDALERFLSHQERALVSVQHINPEVGLNFYWLKEDKFQTMVAEVNALLLADCSQSAGKIDLPKADLIVISAHKFGGPIGAGALLVTDFSALEPVGGHERGYRQGTENLPAILGMAAALQCGGIEEWSTTREDRREFEKAIQQTGQLVSPSAFCGTTGIIAVAHPTLSAQAQLIRLDAMGFAVSAGSACSSGTLKKSRVLDAFGVPDDVAARTIRVSLGWNTTAEDRDAFAEAGRSLT